MSRPALEVADIFRGHGPAWRQAHAGHISLDQLKVMSAIENCRTSALGGHVARCADCAYTTIAYNSCRNRHCPKCQGAAAKDWLADREVELLTVLYYHVVFTLPAPIADIAYQNKAVVYDLLFKVSAETMLTIAADPSRRQNRHHHRAAHLGLGTHPSSARAHDRAGRRDCARWQALGLVPAGLLSAGARALTPVPPAVPGEAHRSTQTASVLRQSHSARQCPGLRRVSGAAAQDRMGRLFKAPVRRTRGGAGLSLPLYPPRCHRQ